MYIKGKLLWVVAALGAPALAQTCQPSVITPYLNINGTSSWEVKSSAKLNTGSRVVLGPQPFDGSWSWSGCGTSGASREQALKLTSTCTATATFANSCGAKSTQNYTFKVWPAMAANAGKFIMVDQFGYRPTMKKVAVLRYPQVGYDAGQYYQPTQLRIVDANSGAVVLDNLPVQVWNGGKTDQPEPGKQDGGWSGDKAWWVDFSQLTTPGTYEVVDVGNNQRSARFDIADNIYRRILIQAVRMFYYQRSGQERSAGNAGAGWADAVDHLGPGQDSQARRFLDPNNAATTRDMRGAWFDAGDYNKYTPWTASYIQELLDAYIQNPIDSATMILNFSNASSCAGDGSNRYEISVAGSAT